jgi:outer membrane protein assembly factor BamB
MLCLGACPHEVRAADTRKPPEPRLAPLLPSESAWLVNLPMPPSAPGAMDDTRVYVPLEGERFVALKRETGETVWTADIESQWPPLVNDGVVYVAASDELHALDAATGMHRWRVPLGRGPMAPLAIEADTIVTLVAPDAVWALRLSDGALQWSLSLGGTDARAMMAIDHGRIFVSKDSRVVRIDLSDHKVKWDRTLPGMLGAPAIGKDRVLVGSTSNHLYALDPDRGGVEWSFQMGGDVVGAFVDGDTVFVVSFDNVLRALKRTNGNQIWKRALTTRPITAPRAVGGIVAVSGISVPLATFNAKTGMPIATFDAVSDLEGMPMFAAALSPYTVALVAIARDGRATGQRPVAMMFRETALEPLAVLPGKALTKERTLPSPTEKKSP